MLDMNNDTLNNLHVLLINLDSSVERLERMKVRLAHFSIEFERVKAISKDTLQYTEKEFDDNLFKKRFGKKVMDTEICCYFSHKKAIDTFLSANKQYALILEDDMIFDDDCFDVIKELIEDKFDWDFIKLNASRDGKGLSGWVVKNLSNRRKLCASMFPKLKSGAYLINRKAAERLSKRLLPMSVPFDHEMIKFYKYGIRQYSVFPSPDKGRQFRCLHNKLLQKTHKQISSPQENIGILLQIF